MVNGRRNPRSSIIPQSSTAKLMLLSQAFVCGLFEALPRACLRRTSSTEVKKSRSNVQFVLDSAAVPKRQQLPEFQTILEGLLLHLLSSPGACASKSSRAKKLLVVAPSCVVGVVSSQGRTAVLEVSR